MVALLKRWWERLMDVTLIDPEKADRRRQKEKSYSCYYVTIHFASVEDAAYFISNRLDDGERLESRLQRGGETLRMCKP